MIMDEIRIDYYEHRPMNDSITQGALYNGEPFSGIAAYEDEAGSTAEYRFINGEAHGTVRLISADRRKKKARRSNYRTLCKACARGFG